MIKLLVGLGNPGPQYQHTRHNIGADFAAQVVEQYNGGFRLENKFKGDYAKIVVAQQECHVLIPTTFMNLSGGAVLALSQFYKIMPDEMLICHDELDLPVGTARLKLSGGHGGHNGLRDIIARLNSNNFYRLRLGIGHPGHASAVSNYVLSKPSKDEQPTLLQMLDNALAVFPTVMTGSINQAMQVLHTS